MIAIIPLVDFFGDQIGCEHLFKRATLLLKAWCLYESPKYAEKPIIGGEGGLTR
jgi:hypothetical protein